VPFHTVTAEFLKNGLSIEFKEAKEGTIVIVGKVSGDGLPLKFFSEAWSPLPKLSYAAKGKENETDESGQTVEKNLAKDDVVKVNFKDTPSFDESKFIDDLQKPISKLTGLKTLSNKADGGDGPLKKDDGRKDQVKSIQQMLHALDFYLGESGENKDGVDGIFGNKTKNAVLSFQNLYSSDKENEPLAVDGLVGPETIKALARECVRAGILKYYISIGSKDSEKDLVWTANRGFIQNEGVDLKAIYEFKENDGKKVSENLDSLAARTIDMIPSKPLTFEEDNEPAKWMFVYMSPEDDSSFLKHSFVTNEEGILQSWDDGEPSRILDRSKSYDLFYDWRPWSEDMRKELKKEDCQTVTIDEEIVLKPKSGDIDLVLQYADGTPLKNQAYTLHLPENGSEEGVTGESGDVQKTDQKPGIIRLGIGNSRSDTQDQGQGSSFEDTETNTGDSPESVSEEDSIKLFEEFVKEMEGSEVTPSTAGDPPELTDDVFIINSSVFQKGEVIACRGKKCTIRMLNGLRDYGEFFHWKLTSSGVYEDPDHELLLLQNPKRRILPPKK
jgi:hypothetical protein